MEESGVDRPRVCREECPRGSTIPLSIGIAANNTQNPINGLPKWPVNHEIDTQNIHTQSQPRLGRNCLDGDKKDR
jgi:hypothetical protein